jgi:glycosyltransferase involved in cell wall biosynthesis
MITMLPRSVLLVGTFLSKNRSGSRSASEELAERLHACDWRVLTTSAQLGKIARLADVAATAWCCRNDYAVAQVAVFSGPAFVWAETVCAVLRLAGKPYVLTLHGGNLPVFARRWPGRVLRLLASAERVTTPSRFLLEQMQPYRTDLLLLPNALDLSRYAFQLRIRPTPRMVWLRALHAIYNPPLAVRVLAQLQEEFPDATLMMVGPDKGDGSLEATRRVAQELGIAGQLHLPGGVSKAEVPVWLQQGDIFLNTTNVDNTPVSVVEAMACGLCVVSTNVGGIPYLLEHEHDALLVPPDDPQAMASAVRRILRDPALAERLSRNARAKAEQFDWVNVLPQWETLLRSVAEGGQQAMEVDV